MINKCLKWKMLTAGKVFKVLIDWKTSYDLSLCSFGVPNIKDNFPELNPSVKKYKSVTNVETKLSQFEDKFEGVVC